MELHPFRPIKNRQLDTDLYACPGQPVFITIRAYQNSFPFSNPALCKMAVSTLLDLQETQNCQIHVYCLMPDHLHFIASPTEDGVSVLKFTAHYKGKTTNQCWQLGWKGKLWQPRLYDHIIRSDESIQAIADYILLNPVRRGLVDSIADWPWSGIP